MGRCGRPTPSLSRWLGEVRPEVLDFRRREAELLFRRIGITFSVYGEADAQERLIPFDVIPRILSAAEWDAVRAGLEQRVRAINLYIKDVYGNARHPQGRRRARRPRVPEPGLPAGDERPERPARHLCASRRHRHRAGRLRRLSTCSKTMRARPPACPTCWRTARSCCGCFRSCSRATAWRRSRIIPMSCWPH